MSCILVASGAALLAATGCTDMCLFGGCYYGPDVEVVVAPEEITTDFHDAPIGLGIRSSASELPVGIERALRTNVALVDSEGRTVATEAVISAPSTGEESLQWCKAYRAGDATRCVTLTPEVPLLDGWYTLVVGDGLQSYLPVGTTSVWRRFHVGSLPLLTLVSLYSKGGTTGIVRFSETVELTNIDDFISIHSLADPQKRCRSSWVTSPTAPSLSVSCDFSIVEQAELTVVPGVKSPSGVPLQDLEGKTSFTIRLGAPNAEDPAQRWSIGGFPQ